MKKVILWFFLCCKRYLKRIPFLLLLAALPLTALAASRMENGKDGTVRIAVCCLDPEPASLGNRLKENLLARDTGLFSFYPCENEQQVRDHVAARKAECGYLIPENLEQKINSGRFKRSITVFSAPSTMTASLSTEVVFSELAAIQNKDILEDYVEQGAAFDALGAAIPFFIIGSLVFCPVFFDAERLLPGLGQAGRLFLPYYYLRGFFHWP